MDSGLTNNPTSLVILGSIVSLILPTLGQQCRSSLRTLFENLFEVFLRPILSGKRLVKTKIAPLIGLRSKEHLVEYCSTHAKGLQGLLESKQRLVDPEVRGREPVGVDSNQGAGGEKDSSSDDASDDESSIFYDVRETLGSREEVDIAYDRQRSSTPSPSTRKRSASVVAATARGQQRRG